MVSRSRSSRSAGTGRWRAAQPTRCPRQTLGQKPGKAYGEAKSTSFLKWNGSMESIVALSILGGSVYRDVVERDLAAAGHMVVVGLGVAVIAVAQEVTLRQSAVRSVSTPQLNSQNGT